MLKSIVVNNEFIKKVISDEEYTLEPIKKEELGIIKEFIVILEPFEEATRMISGNLKFSIYYYNSQRKLIAYVIFFPHRDMTIFVGKVDEHCRTN